MSSTHSLEWSNQSDSLERDIEALRVLLSRLSEATLHIHENLDSSTILDEVVKQASLLTDARYGALVTFDESGAVRDVATYGITQEQQDAIPTLPEGLGLLGYLNQFDRPLRVADVASHPKSIGVPENHPEMTSFLGAPIRRGSEHVGNIYLTNKGGVSEFTQEDEDVIAMFAAQAGTSISNARRREEELRAKSDLETLINISPVAVAVYDAKTGEELTVNLEYERMRAAMGMTGRSHEEAMAEVTMRRPDGRELPISEWPTTRALIRGETVRAEELVAHRRGVPPLTSLVNCSPIYSEQGDIVSVLVISQDITPLRESEQLRAEFLGMVSEQLRAPLTTIKGSTSSLLSIHSTQESSESRQLLRIIDQQADLMRSQINSLIELTHIQTGTLSITSEPEDIGVMVEEAIREFMRSQPGRAVETDVATDLPRVSADKPRISQVLQRLLSHASMASPEGSAIQVKAVTEDFNIVVSVSADSRGMLPTEIVPALRTYSHPMQDTATGDNLALTISKGIVEAHGGRLSAKRGPAGRGLTLAFTLPIADDEPSTPSMHPAPQETEHHDTSTKSKVTVLVAVDDSRMLGAVRRMLISADYTPVTTLDLSDVGRLMEDEDPDVVLLDLKAPRTVGLELMQSLSQDYDVPVIVLSGQGDDESIAQAFEMGADDYIVKPFSPTELIARIKASLRKQTAAYRAGAPSIYALGNVAINYAAHTVTVAGELVHLTATEYGLLIELSTRAGRVLTQDELLERVWGPEYLGQPQLLRAFVKTLRQKLGDDAREPRYIFTEHGIGYRMPKP